MRKSSNLARKRRRTKSQDALDAKRLQHVIKSNGGDAAKYWKEHGRLPEKVKEVREVVKVNKVQAW